MRINDDNQTVDIEARDINYIFPAYVRNYLFMSKNVMPRKIVFPLFPNVVVDGVVIPIEYISPDGEIAAEIAKDGSNIKEITPEQEAMLDEKDIEIAKLKAQLASIEGDPDTPVLSDEEIAKLSNPLDSIEVDINKATGVQVEWTREEAKEEPPVSKAKQAFAGVEAERLPKQPPGGDIGTGQPLSNSSPRDSKDGKTIAKDLQEGPDIDETGETEMNISRDDKGKPVVEG